MEKRIFGKTGEQVSLLGFGCMRLPLNGPDNSCIDEEKASDMIRAAIDGGVNYIDTAWPYHGCKGFSEPGESEPFTGRALKNGYREKVKLATKLPTWLVKTQADMNRTLDAQLRRLDTGHIDFYLAHGLDAGSWSAMQAAGMSAFLEEARRDGRIRHIGFSFHDRFGVFKEIVEGYDWEFTQIQYNYLDQTYQAGRDGLNLAAAKGLGIAIMEPLRGGFLTNQLPDQARALLSAARPAWSPADWGLRWLWDQPAVHVVLSGMNTLDQVNENLRIAADSRSRILTDQDTAALDQVIEYFTSQIRVNCTACGYCLPCPSGVDIPKNFQIYNEYHLGDSDAQRNRAKFIYSLQSEATTAAACVGCEECEGKCPQSLPVSEEMRKVAALFQA